MHLAIIDVYFQSYVANANADATYRGRVFKITPLPSCVRKSSLCSHFLHEKIYDFSISPTNKIPKLSPPPGDQLPEQQGRYIIINNSQR